MTDSRRGDFWFTWFFNKKDPSHEMLTEWNGFSSQGGLITLKV